jgi:hypothetical protein
MISFIFITCSTFFTTFLFYKIDAHKIICENVKRKYIKWQKINNLVSSHHKDLISIYRISIKMIFQALYLALIQYLNNSVTKIDKNTYLVEYVVGGKVYKMIVLPKKGPSPIIQIRDHNEKDITDYILPYFGPNYDWHHVGIIPQFFACEKMTFELDDGSQKIFDELEYINI